MGTAIQHPVPDRVKPSFVIFDIRALWRSWRLNPVWHRMRYSCTHMATVGLKGLTTIQKSWNLESRHDWILPDIWHKGWLVKGQTQCFPGFSRDKNIPFHKLWQQKSKKSNCNNDLHEGSFHINASKRVTIGDVYPVYPVNNSFTQIF